MSKSKSKSKSQDEIPVEKIHTANDWEHADLGDEERKQKFLRLMGAKKRKEEEKSEPKAKEEEDPVPEKKHCRSKAETESINLELEKQFNESLQSKITHKRHGGLGFQGDEPSSSTDWHQQALTATFVPEQQQSEEKPEKEKKKKSKSKE